MKKFSGSSEGDLWASLWSYTLDISSTFMKKGLAPLTRKLTLPGFFPELFLLFQIVPQLHPFFDPCKEHHFQPDAACWFSQSHPVRCLLDNYPLLEHLQGCSPVVDVLSKVLQGLSRVVLRAEKHRTLVLQSESLQQLCIFIIHFISFDF